MVSAYCEVLEFAREKGWVEYSGGFSALVYWWLGTIDGRVHLEIGGGEAHLADWDRLFTTSIMVALFGSSGT